MYEALVGGWSSLSPVDDTGKRKEYIYQEHAGYRPGAQEETNAQQSTAEVMMTTVATMLAADSDIV